MVAERKSTGPPPALNTASKCGYTPQYAGLQELYERYGEGDLVVIGFPSNDFGNQEPGTAEEIGNFCRLNYGVTFPMMAKVHTKGPNQAPVYRTLTTESEEDFRGEIRWNFTKFLVDQEGRVVARFESAVEPLESEYVGDTQELEDSLQIVIAIRTSTWLSGRRVPPPFICRTPPGCSSGFSIFPGRQAAFC